MPTTKETIEDKLRQGKIVAVEPLEGSLRLPPRSNADAK